MKYERLRECSKIYKSVRKITYSYERIRVDMKMYERLQKMGALSNKHLLINWSIIFLNGSERRAYNLGKVWHISLSFRDFYVRRVLQLYKVEHLSLQAKSKMYGVEYEIQLFD